MLAGVVEAGGPTGFSTRQGIKGPSGHQTKSLSSGNTRTYNSPDGSSAGRSVNQGNSRVYYDKYGNVLVRTQKVGIATYYYDRYGSLILISHR